MAEALHFREVTNSCEHCCEHEYDLSRIKNFDEKVEDLLTILRKDLLAIFESEIRASTQANNCVKLGTKSPSTRLAESALRANIDALEQDGESALLATFDVLEQDGGLKNVRRKELDVEAISCGVKHFRSEAGHFAHEAQSFSPTLSSESRSVSLPQLFKLRNERVERCVFLETDSRVSMWNLIHFCTLFLVAWNDTLLMSQPWYGEGSGPLGSTFDQITLAIFALDILATFNIAVEGQGGEVITNRREIALRYLRSWFGFDLFVTLPYDRLFDSAPNMRTARILRLVKIFRWLKLARRVASGQMVKWLGDLVEDITVAVGTTPERLTETFTLIRGIFSYILLVLLESHLLACLVLSFAATGDESLSFESENVDVANLDPFLRYVIVLRWVAAALTAGIAEDSVKLLVHHTAPQILRICLTIIFAINLIYAISSFANLKLTDDSNYDHRIQIFKLHLRKVPSISKFTRNRILEYLQHASERNRCAHAFALIDDMPPHMQVRLAYERFAVPMSSFPLFLQGPFKDRTVCAAFLGNICNSLKVHLFWKEELVVTMGMDWEGLGCITAGCCEKGELRNSVETQPSRQSMRATQSQLVSVATDHWSLAYQPMTESFFGVEALFAPKGCQWQTSRCSIRATTNVEVAVLCRNDFDLVAEADTTWSIFMCFVRTKLSTQEISIDGLTESGLSKDLLIEYASFEAHGGDVASEDLGVCCQYLADIFPVDLVSEFGTIDLEETTFHDLRALFWNDDHKGFNGSAAKVCPRDGMPGSSIVDTLDEDWKRFATHFVSWCWNYTIRIILSSLALWSGRQETEVRNIFLWMCFFCNNQRALLIEGRCSNLADTFASRLQRFGRMVSLLDTFRNPVYTSRLWCIFETHTAVTNQIHIDVALPQASQEEFELVLRSPRGFSSLIHALTNINVESATAYSPQDETSIKQHIRDTTGFVVVNETVKGALTKWLALAFERCLMAEIRPMRSLREPVDDLEEADEDTNVRSGVHWTFTVAPSTVRVGPRRTFYL